MDDETLVFVYGTLKAGFPNYAVNRGVRVEGGEWVTWERYPLVLAGPWWVPCLLDLPGRGERVSGEVYRVDAAGLAALDELEWVGRPGGYQREEIAVVLPGRGEGASERAQVYFRPVDVVEAQGVRLGLLGGYTAEYTERYIPPHGR